MTQSRCYRGMLPSPVNGGTATGGDRRKPFCQISRVYLSMSDPYFATAPRAASALASHFKA